MRLAAAAVVAAVAAAAAVAAPASDITVQDCAAQIYVVPPNKLPVAGAPGNLTLGPLTIAYFTRMGDRAAFLRHRHGGEYHVKAVLAVRAGGAVTLRGAGVRFAFGVGDHPPRSAALRFVQCETSGTEVTGFAGTVIVTLPGCYRFEARTGARTYRRLVSFGAGRC
jgi:opacity protein-like surface antigen